MVCRYWNSRETSNYFCSYLARTKKSKAPVSPVPVGARRSIVPYMHNKDKPPADDDDNGSHRRRIAFPGGLDDRENSPSDAPPAPPASPKISGGNLRGQRNQHNQRHCKNTPPRHQLSGVAAKNSTLAIRELRPQHRTEH